MIEAKTICDSIGKHSPRLFTIRTTAPKFIHQETLRHRLIYIEDQLHGDFDFSFSVSSARAIPFARLLGEVRDPNRRAKPVKWGAEQRGMSMGDEIECLEQAELVWSDAARVAADCAERMAAFGIHKSICNRIIEPYTHVHALMTATEPGWLNFFGLRLDKAADPTLHALAEACWKCWCESKPRLLKPGEWHLPFVDLEDVDKMFGHPLGHLTPEEFKGPKGWAVKVSVARCARLSYESFDTGRRSTIEEDLALYERLVGNTPIHASPAEHQATPDSRIAWKEIERIGGPVRGVVYGAWTYPTEAGNLGPGWRQYRKMLPGEALAPLPKNYS